MAELAIDLTPENMEKILTKYEVLSGEKNQKIT